MFIFLVSSQYFEAFYVELTTSDCQRCASSKTACFLFSFLSGKEGWGERRAEEGICSFGYKDYQDMPAAPHHNIFLDYTSKMHFLVPINMRITGVVVLNVSLCFSKHAPSW